MKVTYLLACTLSSAFATRVRVEKNWSEKILIVPSNTLSNLDKMCPLSRGFIWIAAAAAV